nr:hypothetical protein [Algoriphagus sp.]
MEELILYAVLFLLLIGHTLLASKMYRKVHENSSLSLREKNDWKLKALIFPGYFWFLYQKSQGKSS